MTALFLGDLLQRNIIDGRRGGRVNILPGPESAQHAGILGHMRHDAQFDLRVVYGEQHIPGRGNKTIAHPPPLRSPDGDVLQIWIGRRQAARHRAGLAVRSMHASGLGIHDGRKGLDICGLKLGELPVFDDHVHDRMLAAERVQDIGRGRVVSACGLAPPVGRLEAQPGEEHIGQLLG